MSDLFDTPWRRMAAAIFERPRDGRVFGMMDIDVTDAMAWMRERNAAGARLTPTHLVTTAFAHSIAFDCPQLNCVIRFGRVYPREDVGCRLPIDRDGQDLGSILIRELESKTITQVAEEMNQKVEVARVRNEDPAMQNRNGLAALPWPLRKWAYDTARWLVHEVGVPVGSFRPGMFGSFMVTNVGPLGLTVGYPALMPASDVPFVVAMGKITRKPLAIDEEVVIRDVIPICATFDHRVIDGSGVAKLAKGVLKRLADPALMDELPQT